MANKGFLVKGSIAIKKIDTILTYKAKLVESYNSHYINVVEKMSATPLEIEENLELKNNDKSTVKSIIGKYENHSSTANIKIKIINKIIKELNPKKTTGLDKIPPKIAKH